MTAQLFVSLDPRWPSGGILTGGADFERSWVVTPSSTLLQGINVGQLRRSGVVLYPREVVAVVHALCDQEVCVPTPDELWITDGGHVLVGDPGGAAAAAPTLAAMGVLIDSLLPPFSEARQYAPAASLHTLPARLRGAAEPPIVSTRELLYVIEPYETDAPARVLQQLVARAIAAAPARPGREAVASAPVDSDSTALLIVPFEGRDDALDEYPSEQIVRTGVDSAAAPDRLSPVRVVADAPETAATAAPRSPMLTLVAVLCVGISLGLFGYGGYWLVSHLEKHAGQTAVPATIDPPPSLSAHPIGAGIGRLLPSSASDVPVSFGANRVEGAIDHDRVE